MFSHIMIGADDINAAKQFYDAALGGLGVKAGFVDPKGRIIYTHSGGMLIVTKPINGQPASGANGGTLGFAAATPEQADAFHAAGVANGGTAIEDAPGWRELGTMKLYLSYLRDPSGNKICAMVRG
jgi:catechol 2,3-dioxygenase-like lactoylglutathione lyase family enzyme